MRKFVLFLSFIFLLVPFAHAELRLSLDTVKVFNQEGHSVPLILKVKNVGTVTENIPNYFVPYFDFELQVIDEQGRSVERSSSVYDLAYMKPVDGQALPPGGTYEQKIDDLRALYRTDELGLYQVSPVYYPSRNRAAAVTGPMTPVPVGNVAGDRGFLAFSDTAYIERSFCFTAVYPNANYLLRDFSNNYFIFGLSSSWLQAGVGYSDGAYGGVKWQVWKEEGIRPAFAAQYYQWDAGREVITVEREVLGYWTEEHASTYVFSKRTPFRSHLHIGAKRFEVNSKLESESPVSMVFPLTMIAVDQSYTWGMLLYERDYDMQQGFLSEAFMYRGLPSWDPQVGIGLLRYDDIGHRDVTMFFFSLHFYVDNFLLGYSF